VFWILAISQPVEILKLGLLLLLLYWWWCAGIGRVLLLLLLSSTWRTCGRGLEVYDSAFARN
jgi:hypothetical protein